MRPLQVSRAVAMLWASLALGIVTSALDWGYVGSVAAPAFTLTVLAVVLALTALLVAMIARGRNWARITFLVLFLVGAVPYVPNFVAMLGRSVLTGAVSLLQLALQIVALYLLFTRPGAGWFRRKPDTAGG